MVLLKIFVFVVREREREGEKKWEIENYDGLLF